MKTLEQLAEEIYKKTNDLQKLITDAIMTDIGKSATIVLEVNTTPYTRIVIKNPNNPIRIHVSKKIHNNLDDL